MKIKIQFLFIAAVFIVSLSFAQTSILIDDFNGDNSIAGLQNRGWIVVDNDGGGNAAAWFQGNPNNFTSFEGPDSGYVASNFAGANGNLIDHWLISPPINYAVGDSLFFYLRSPDGSEFPDSLTLLYSQNAGTNLQNFIFVGQVLSPTNGWTPFFATFGFTGSIRFAFRYLMYDGGADGFSSDYMGIDFVYLVKQQNYPAQITVSRSFSFGDVTRSTSYRMIGLPGNNNLPISQFFTGEHKKDWNVFYDNGADTDFLLEFNGQATFNFTPGKGFWALSRNPITISERQVNSANLTGNAFRVSLHDGWNIISNPFEKNVSVTDIRAANGLAQNAVFHNFNGSFPAAGTTTLVPYEGYYFFNDGTHPTLNIPYPFTVGKVHIDDSQVSVAKQNLKISLNSNEGSKEIIVGINPSSSNNFDEMDFLAPPSYFEDVSINLVNKNLSVKHKNLFIEHRPEIGQGQVFNFEVKNKSGEKVTLSADGLNNFESYEIYLLDERLNKLYNLHEQNAVSISPIHQNNKYSLLIGNKDFINNRKETLVSKEFALYQNYPNPFNPGTIIQYTIPASLNPSEGGTLVNLKVYDILGNLVTTLVNNVQAPGIYEVEFDGSGLSSGMYIYEIHAGSFKEVKKMSLLK